MNCVQLIGRLTHDPEGDRASDGKPVATFRLAVDRPHGTSADFVTVKVWDRLAEAVTRHLRRGRRVALHGRLFHEEWTRADGHGQTGSSCWGLGRLSRYSEVGQARVGQPCRRARACSC